MISVTTFRTIVKRLGQVANDDIAETDALCLPETPEEFADSCIYVICNSGMKNAIALGIYEKVMRALRAKSSASTVFGHEGKTAAIDRIWKDRRPLFETLTRTRPSERLDFLESLPWIGGITKYHLAKSFGMDVAKPDVHLKRLADLHGVTAQRLCADLAKKTGHRVATVDTVLWRACERGVLNSKTGELT